MERKLDNKGRWRNHTVAFRVSEEESKLLNDFVELSGLTKPNEHNDKLSSPLHVPLVLQSPIRKIPYESVKKYDYAECHVPLSFLKAAGTMQF